MSGSETQSTSALLLELRELKRQRTNGFGDVADSEMLKCGEGAGDWITLLGKLSCRFDAIKKDSLWIGG